MRTPAWSRARVSAFAVLVLTFPLPGECAKADFRAPVGKFRSAAGVVIHATQIYLSELNKVERDNYIYQQVIRREPILLNKIESVQVFSKQGIAARLEALDILSSYVDLLNRLANSDTPDNIKAQATSLQTATLSLADQVSKLSGEDDMQFKRVASGVLPIVGDILKGFADRAIEDALRKAITAGAEPMNHLIDAIERDTLVAYHRRRSEASGQRVFLLDQYNREVQKGPQADSGRLKTYADQISAEEDRWEMFLSAQPVEGLEALKMANNALVKFVRTPKPGIADFTSFMDTMEWFSDTAVRIGLAVQEVTGK